MVPYRHKFLTILTAEMCSNGIKSAPWRRRYAEAKGKRSVHNGCFREPATTPDSLLCRFTSPHRASKRGCAATCKLIATPARGLRRAFLNLPVIQGTQLRAGPKVLLRLSSRMAAPCALLLIPRWSSHSLRSPIPARSFSTVNLKQGTAYVNFTAVKDDEFSLTFGSETLGAEQVRASACADEDLARRYWLCSRVTCRRKVRRARLSSARSSQQLSIWPEAASTRWRRIFRMHHSIPGTRNRQSISNAICKTWRSITRPTLTAPVT